MDFFNEARTPAQRRCSAAMFESVATISGDREPATAGADGAGAGAHAVDGAGATATGVAVGATPSVGADTGPPSASGTDWLSHGADPAGAEGRPRSPPTGIDPAETAAAGFALVGATAAGAVAADAGATAAGAVATGVAVEAIPSVGAGLGPPSVSTAE